MFGLWLPNLGRFPKNLLIAALYIFGACGAAWILGPLGLRHANRRQRALTLAALPAMVFLGLYQAPDRALASFPYATMIPAALVLSRLPPGLNIALLVASAAFSIRMNTAVSWLPRIPITLALIAAFTLVAVWLDRRGRVRAEPSAPVASASSRPVAVWASAVFVMALVGAVSLRAWRANAERETLTWPPTSSPVLVEDEGNTLALAASPDGEWILFVASDGPAGGAVFDRSRPLRLPERKAPPLHSGHRMVTASAFLRTDV